MAFNILLVVPLLVALVHSVNSNAASFIQKCQLSDSKCLKESTQFAIPKFAAGVPDLGVETLDPFHINKIDASSSSLKLVLNDVHGTGLSQCVAKKVKFEGNNKIIVKLLCSVDIKAIYEVDGSVLVLRIEGHGNAHVVLRKMQITVEANLNEEVGADGLKHWAIKNWKHSYELKDQSTIELENLFNGNEVLGRAARELIATSSNEIVNEIGPPIIKQVAIKIVDNVARIFKGIALDDLVLP